MKYNQIKVEAGRGWPVNPFPEYIRDFYSDDWKNESWAEFETWLSTQPEIFTEAPDRVYNVDEFEPVVWQYKCEPDCDVEWDGCLDNDPTNYIPHSETRQWLELKPAGEKPTAEEMTAFNVDAVYNAIFQPPFSDEQPDKVGEEKPSDEFLKSLPFHDKYFSNETWHPDESDIADMGKECYDEAIAEWQVFENDVLFDDFRVHFESCDCGDGYGCSHGSYPYDLVHAFVDTEMCWEDDGFYIESPSGLIRFDKTADITMYHFVKACELLDLKLKFKPFNP